MPSSTPPALTECPHFPDIEAYYQNNELRRRSREIDFGVQWRGKTSFPNYRVSWVEATGELYLVESGSEQIIYLLAKIKDEQKLEELMQGWADACGPNNSLDWLTEKPWFQQGLGSQERRSAHQLNPDPKGLLYLTQTQ